MTNVFSHCCSESKNRLHVYICKAGMGTGGKLDFPTHLYGRISDLEVHVCRGHAVLA